MTNKVLLKKDTNYDRHFLYQNQYILAIDSLLKLDIKDIYLPLINLISQTIENDLKAFIIDYDFTDDTAKELDVNHHNLEKLVNDEFIIETLENIDKFKKIYELYKKEVLFFNNILGNKTFIKSRYPISIDV